MFAKSFLVEVLSSARRYERKEAQVILQEASLRITLRHMLGHMLGHMRRWRRRESLFALLVAWVIGCILLQQPTLFATKLISVGASLYLLKWLFPKLQQYRWLVYSSLLLARIIGVTGSYHLLLDIGLCGLSAAVAIMYFRRARSRSVSRLSLRAFAVMTLCTWLLWSAGDAIWTVGPAPLHPERFDTLPVDDLAAGKHIGLALSGGGYRATLMHAGVLAGLEKLGLPVTDVSSVSGGSIAAAYYASGGSPLALLDTFKEHKFRLYRDIVDIQNLVRLIFSAQIPGTKVRLLPFYDFSLTKLQAQSIDRALLRNSRFENLAPRGPRLLIGVTDLNSGRSIGVTRNWMVTRFLLRPTGEKYFSNAKSLYLNVHEPRLSRASDLLPLASSQESLARTVAASAAFPLVFEPVGLKFGAFHKFLLSDGGVTDNTGMTLLLTADRFASTSHAASDQQDWLLDIAISSDASAVFTPDDASSSEAFPRALDIIGTRIGMQVPEEPRGAGHPQPPPRLLLSPALYVDNSLTFGVDKQNAPLDQQQKKLLKIICKQITELDAESVPLAESIVPETISPAEYKSDLGYLRERVTVGNGAQISFLNPGHNPSESQDKRALESVSLWPLEPDKKESEIEVQLLAYRVAVDFSRCLQTFFTTPTLRDSFQPEDADRLFRLGEYLVLLNAHEIRQLLADRKGKNKVPTILTELQKHSVMCRASAALLNTAEKHPIENGKSANQVLKEIFGELTATQEAYQECMMADPLTRDSKSTHGYKTF